MPSRQPRVPSIGLTSPRRRTRSSSCSSAASSGARSSRARWTRWASATRSGRNSCSGGSSRRIVIGSPGIAANRPSKSCCCSGSSSSSAARRSGSVRAMIIARIFGWRSAAMNMCSVRHRPMPSAPCSIALRASAGVSALARTPSRRISSAQPSTRSKRSLRAGSDSGTSSRVTTAGAAVDRDPLAAAHDDVAGADRARAQVDLELAGADDRGAAHATGDQRRVRGLAALGGEDSACGVEARDVVGLGERAREDHVATLGRGRDRLLGGEHDLALGGAGRSGHAAREHLEARVGVERRVQQRVERAGVDRGAAPARASAGLRRRRRRRSGRRPGPGAWRCASAACRGGRARP